MANRTAFSIKDGSGKVNKIHTIIYVYIYTYIYSNKYILQIYTHTFKYNVQKKEKKQ